MKRKIIILIIISTILLSACSTPDTPAQSDDSVNSSGTSHINASRGYFDFEDALKLFTTDIVIAQYIGFRLFGERMVEYEFVALDRVMGDTPERIFVYENRRTRNIPVGEIEELESIDLLQVKVLQFNPDTEYLLPLNRVSRVYDTKINYDWFWFSYDIIIDLNNISNSTMAVGLISEHTTSFDFNRNITREEIISYIYEITKDNPPARTFIRSDVLKEIIEGSDNVLIVEINDPFILARESEHGGGTDIGAATDHYFTTVVDILKGDLALDIGDEILITFFADTVFPEEHHLVAVEPTSDGSIYTLTARTSLFEMEQLDEIIEIIEEQSGGVHDCNASGHIWSEWDVITTPTCITASLERRDCIECDDYETRTLDTDPCGECSDCVPEVIAAEYDGTSLSQLHALLAQGDVILTTPSNFGIPNGSTLTIPEDRTLYVSTILNVRRDSILDISGTFEVLEGNRINNDGNSSSGGGIIQINEGGTFINNGYVESASFSFVYNEGTITNNGTTGNNGRFEIRANTTFINTGVVDGTRPLSIHRDAILS